MSEQGTTGQPKLQDYERALQSMDTFIDVSVRDLMTLVERAAYFAAKRDAESLRVSQVMSQPVRTVHPRTTMAEAAHLMIEQRISGLPVVDDAGQLAGIITEADFLRGLGVPAHHPTHNLWQTLELLFGHLAHHADLEGPADPVSDHMQRDVVCAPADQDVYEVIELMKQHRVKRVLVCDQAKQVIGMLTRSDLMRIFFDRYRHTRQG